MKEFLALFYLATAFVWLLRARRSLSALEEIPQVPAARDIPEKATLVSVLIPVKNEEVNIEGCLDTLLSQDYPFLQVIVTNDHSTDATGEILKRYQAKHPEMISVLDSPDLPAGWTGKNWALWNGVREARGEWLLFTDADTRHEPHAVRSALAHAEGRDRDLLTLTPKCLAETFWEKTIQPLAMALLGLWFPLQQVNRADSPSVFGNGQFLFIRKQTYFLLGGHEKVRGNFLEDFALVREAKARRLGIECAIGTNIFGTRMYRSLTGIWLGWRRIFLHAFERRPFVLLLKSINLFAFSLLPFLLFPYLTLLAFTASGSFAPLWGAVWPVFGLILVTLWKAFRIVGAPAGFSLLHPIAAFVLGAVLADSAWVAFTKKELKWR